MPRFLTHRHFERLAERALSRRGLVAGGVTFGAAAFVAAAGALEPLAALANDSRFMVGPRECEVTGIAWSPDRGTLFVGIQHSGEKGNSHFPEGGDSVPRSAVVAIVREDGGSIG